MSDYATVAEVAEELHFHENTIRSWVQRYPDFGVKIGKCYRVHRAAVEQLKSGTPFDELSAA
tara:strand:- start:1101 stop:1286 length:186 start_codon:yes stop_codon:yes gene_type:complete